MLPLTWSRDSMNKSKLTLSLLIPDLRQLGHVHLYRFAGLTVKREGKKELREKENGKRL